MFRAWDPTRNEWITADGLGGREGFNLIGEAILMTGLLNHCFSARAKIGQYIGLNDVNNTPIFEGDIVRRQRPGFKPNGAKNGSVTEEIVVQYVQSSQRNGFTLVTSQYCTVIRNIYEGNFGDSHGLPKLRGTGTEKPVLLTSSCVRRTPAKWQR